MRLTPSRAARAARPIAIVALLGRLLAACGAAAGPTACATPDAPRPDRDRGGRRHAGAHARRGVPADPHRRRGHRGHDPGPAGADRLAHAGHDRDPVRHRRRRSRGRRPPTPTTTRPRRSPLPDVASFRGVDIEKIVGLEADLVVAGGNDFNSPDALRRLRCLGIPVVVVYAPDVAGVSKDIELVATAAASRRPARRWRRRWRPRSTRSATRSPRPAGRPRGSSTSSTPRRRSTARPTTPSSPR